MAIAVVVAGAVLLLLMLRTDDAEPSDGPSGGAATAPGSTAPGTAAPGTTAPGTTAPGTTAPLGGAAIGEGTAPARDGRSPLRGFGEVAATITEGDGTTCEVCLLLAESPEQRARGLMEVTDADLGGYDGMVFVFPDEVDGAFWMRNTPLPLSIAYFDDDGDLVSTTDMAPCDDSSTCPSYPADGPFRFALEVSQGGLADVGVVGDASIELGPPRCPPAPG